ncbi:hypothetical protein ACFLWU_03020 [Chloroflexota bacterium]
MEEVKATPGGEHILACIQCGTCTGSCPMAGAMEYPPRKIIAMIGPAGGKKYYPAAPCGSASPATHVQPVVPEA